MCAYLFEILSLWVITKIIYYSPSSVGPVLFLYFILSSREAQRFLSASLCLSWVKDDKSPYFGLSFGYSVQPAWPYVSTYSSVLVHRTYLFLLGRLSQSRSEILITLRNTARGT